MADEQSFVEITVPEFATLSRRVSILLEGGGEVDVTGTNPPVFQ